jgi:hypothetical protein
MARLSAGAGLNSSRIQALSMCLVVAIPATQGRVIGAFEEKAQGERFNVTVAKHHVDSSLVP